MFFKGSKVVFALFNISIPNNGKSGVVDNTFIFTFSPNYIISALYILVSDTLLSAVYSASLTSFILNSFAILLVFSAFITSIFESTRYCLIILASLNPNCFPSLVSSFTSSDIISLNFFIYY